MHLIVIPIGMVLTYAVCRALGWRRAWSALAVAVVTIALALTARHPNEH